MRRIIIEKSGIGWRRHTKAIEMPAIAHMMRAAGAHGVTCAKLSETEVMAAVGLRNMLIANQAVTESKTARLAAPARHADVIVVVDSAEVVETLNEAVQDVGVCVRAVVEVDIGIYRAGVEPGESVLRPAHKVASQPHLHFAGVMGWEGQTASIASEEQKRAAVGDLTASANLCRRAGLAVGIVSCGGTGTYWITAGMPGVTEVRAGGGIFCYSRYRKEFGVPHEYALTVWTAVTSRPTSTRIVCDAGREAMSCYPRTPEPTGLGELGPLRMAAEHATIELVTPAWEPQVGDRIKFKVGYSNSAVCLHDTMYAFRNGRFDVVWPILDRGKLQ